MTLRNRLLISITIALLATDSTAQSPGAKFPAKESVRESNTVQQAALRRRADVILTRNESLFIALRHDLHRNPETSGNEVRTARLVAERLRASGLEVRVSVGGHGVVALLKGSRPGPLIAYRADMDAVQSSDPDPVEYRSVLPNVRHICGHDIHTAIGVALATALAGVRDELTGNVMFIFQPAEETATGAKAMIADSAFTTLWGKPVAIYGVHTAPYEVGVIGTRPGVMMSIRDALTITVSGTGNVAAASDSVRNFLASIATVTGQQQFQTAPADFLGVQLNPNRSVAGATIVSAMLSLATDAARQRVIRLMGQKMALLQSNNVKITQQHEIGVVAGITNSIPLTNSATAALKRELGDSSVREVTAVIPAFSEDFGSFQALVPGTFFFLGVSNATQNWVGMPHSPGYVADDRAIRFGAQAMLIVLLDRLSR